MHNINTLTNMKSRFLPPLFTQVQMPNFSIANSIDSTFNNIDNNKVMNNNNTSSIRAIT